MGAMSCARSRVEVRLISTSHYYSGAERSIGLREAVTVRTGQWEGENTGSGGWEYRQGSEPDLDLDGLREEWTE
jgi:hypothetical protein